MVQSLLDSVINYPELKDIDPQDIDYDAPVYEVEIDDVIVNIALGNAKYAFVDNEIVYFNIYLANGEKIISQIGVYEIMEESLPNITDKDGEPDLSKMNKPLLYSFVNKDVLVKSMIDGENAAVNANNNGNDGDDSDNGDNGDDGDGDDGDISTTKGKKQPIDKSKTDNWVQLFMNSMSYGVKNNEGGGDCFFATIRDGLSTIGKTVTVSDLRNRLSNAATPELYTEYRTIYEDIAKGLEDINAKIKQQTEKAKEIKSNVEKVTNRQEKSELLEQAKNIRDVLKQLREEKQVQNEIVKEFKWIAKLTSFPKFVKALRTCSFWADDWATSVIERLYNIKVILLSEESFEEGDLNNVIRCGRADDELMEKGIFRPTDYIMMVYTGNHYKLITVDGKGAFTFNELPKEIVAIVKNKCLERNAGLYSIIPEFVHGLDIKDEVIEDPGDLNLHGETTVFQFYDQAATKPAPGKGSGEKLGPEGVAAYKGLTKDWRRKLSHGYEKQIKLDNHMWKSVDHYVEANKFIKNNNDVYIKFALDSGSELSNNVAMAKAYGSNRKYENKTIRPKSVKVDDDWDDYKMSEVLMKALVEKFKNEEFANILKNTKDAKLMLYKKGQPARIEIELMRVRSKL